MNCDDCRQQLQARLDGGTVPADEIAAHLAACPECQGLEAAARRLQTGLRLLTPPAPPAGSAERLVAGVLTDRRRRIRRRRLAFAGTATALAAALLLALFALPDGRGSRDWLTQAWDAVKERFFPGPTLTDWDLATDEPSDPHPVEESPAPSLNDNMAKATSAMASLARRTADETVSNGQLLVPAVSLPMTEPEVLGPPLEPPAQSLREAGHGVAVGLEPVTSSAVRAFDLFRRDIAPMTPAGE
jgi:hypothetical protein